jgi:hypothetical protein
MKKFENRAKSKKEQLLKEKIVKNVEEICEMQKVRNWKKRMTEERFKRVIDRFDAWEKHRQRSQNVERQHYEKIVQQEEVEFYKPSKMISIIVDLSKSQKMSEHILKKAKERGSFEEMRKEETKPLEFSFWNQSQNNSKEKLKKKRKILAKRKLSKKNSNI